MGDPIQLYGVEWATAEEVVAQLGADVTPAMLDQWARRGLVRRVTIGSGRTRQAHYRLDDCTEAEAWTRLQTRGRPRQAA